MGECGCCDPCGQAVSKPYRLPSAADLLRELDALEAEISCTTCRRDLSKNGYRDWRIKFEVDRIPQLHSYDPDPSPLDGTYYFCDLDCARTWLAL